VSCPYPRYAESASGHDSEQLLKDYLPLIRYHADQLMRRVPDSVETDDLIDAGVVGLLEGARRFDESRNIQFKTFISYRVRGAMVDYLRTLDWFPRSMRDSAKELQQALVRLEQEYGRPAEEAEVAAFLHLGIDEYRERLAEVKGMAIVYFSDLPPVEDYEDAWQALENIADDPENAPDRHAAMSEFTEMLAEAIRSLPMREKVLLSLYYYEELNMKEVALVLGLTESRVSQLHSQMVLRLRGFLKLDNRGDGF